MPPFLAARAGRPLLPALAAIALFAAACAPGVASSSSPVATTTVDLPPSYRFAPSSITVSAGATVTWTNRDNFSHNVSFEGSAPLPMAPGQSVTHTFAGPGTYPYACSLHPRDMRGTVLVTDA